MTDNHDEFDVDLDAELPADVECTEFVGEFPNFEAFARQSLETLVLVDGMWLLDCLDWGRVEEAMTSGGRYRYRVSDERMFRDTIWRPDDRTE